MSGNGEFSCAPTSLSAGYEPAVRRRTILLRAAIIVWSAVVAAGFLYGFHYSATPAPTAGVPVRWPDASVCTLSSDRPTLVMFVHPRCPCSRASLSELERLVSRAGREAFVQVVFLQPDSAPENWHRTDLWENARRMPRVVVRADRGGSEHRRFSARVSGETFLFRPDGSLAFHGGITGGRGHAGDNPGRSALESLLADTTLPLTGAPVFGCELNHCTPPQRATTAGRAESQPAAAQPPRLQSPHSSDGDVR